jgi:hypothetical protein
MGSGKQNLWLKFFPRSVCRHFWVLGMVILCYFSFRTGCEGKAEDDYRNVHQTAVMVMDGNHPEMGTLFASVLVFSE